MKHFFASSKANGIVLIGCTILSLLLANSAASDAYLAFWHQRVAGMPIEHWINDGLMAVFFLAVGLELKHELYQGELADFRKALLPIVAAVGGICMPALLHFGLNAGTATQSGIGIPMATDIAFALGVLVLLGRRVPASLKIFLTAVAVIDDLVAIALIAFFYTDDFRLDYILGAMAVFGALVCLARFARVTALAPYLAGGALLWVLMLMSGIHATIAGVLLAFAIPDSAQQDDEGSPSHRLRHLLHKPIAFMILPLFALANTGIVLAAGWMTELASPNSLGIVAGLVLGKPAGIFLFSFAAVALGACKLPRDLSWRHVFGAALLGGIGFTMSIFIANLAFPGHPDTVTAAKIAVLLASLTAGLLGLTWLRLVGRIINGYGPSG